MLLFSQLLVFSFYFSQFCGSIASLLDWGGAGSEVGSGENFEHVP